MPWFHFAILSAIFFAGSNILDKFILEKRIKNYLAYFIAGGSIWFVFALILFSFLFLSPISTSLPIILLSIASGILAGTTWLLWYKALSKEEVSRTIAVYYLYPIFVALLARIFLREEISFLKWLAIVLAVCGAILISLKREKLSQKIVLRTVFPIILLASFIEGAMETIDKYVLFQISPWHLIVLGSFGLFIMTSLIFICSLNSRRETIRIFLNFSILKPVLLVNFLYFLATLLFFFAASLASITYVSAVSVSQPLFVFLLTIILSWRFPQILQEPIDRRTILIKIFSIILVVGGILIIILT